MHHFRYKINKNGTVKMGVIDAESPHRAALELQKLGGTILQLQAVTEHETEKGSSSSRRTFAERFLIFGSQVELSLRQLASLLKAGVPIMEALQSVGEQSPPLLRNVHARIAEKVRHGYPMKKTLQEEAACFGNITIGLIGIGEANGTLDEMFRYSADLMERSRKVRSLIVQAFTYPAIVLAVAAGISYFLVAHVLPKIVTFISKQSKQIELPLPTRILMETNDFLCFYGMYLLAAPIILGITYFFARKNPVLCEQIDRLCLRCPLLGKAYRDHCNTMWCRTLGALLKSGIDILTALKLVEEVMNNRHYALQFNKMCAMVKQGESFSKSVRKTTLGKWCPMALSMIAVSEKSGTVDTSLLHVADYCEEQLGRRVIMLGKFIEPAIFIIIGGIVGFIYFAFFLAMIAATHSAA